MTSIERIRQYLKENNISQKKIYKTYRMFKLGNCKK